MSVKTLESMITWIDDHITEKPTLSELSDHVGYSSFYCSSKFHEYTQITYKRYLSKRKLELAALDIIRKDEKILHIALRYGFTSHAAFTRAFVVHYGCTPKQYRQNHKREDTIIHEKTRTQ